MADKKPVSPEQFARVAWGRIVSEVRGLTAPRKPRVIRVGSSDSEIAAQIQTRQTPRFFGLIPEQAALLARFFPDAADATLIEAAEAAGGRFRLDGPEFVTCPSPIDWHRDPRSGFQWPVEHISRMGETAIPPEADVRLPRHLSRFHHALRLGQAYLYTEDNAYAEAACAQIGDWIEHNPYEFGVNWQRPQDVATRAVNWIWAYYCLIESKALTPKFLTLWIASLREHGNYLLKYLPDSRDSKLATLYSVVGLAYLGILFPEFNEAARWRAIGLARLWEELERQIAPDGLFVAGGTALHRAVTEMSLSVAGLCVVNGIEIPTTAQVRLGSMLNIVMAYIRPDGSHPAIGDDPGERMLMLGNSLDPATLEQDHRHVLGLGSLVLERQLNEWAGFVDPTQRGWALAAGNAWQDAFWCFASDAAARYTDLLTQTTRRPENVLPDAWVNVTEGVRVRARALATTPLQASEYVRSRGFEASGIYVMRQAEEHLVIHSGLPLPEPGVEPHADLFSFTLWAHNAPLLIDPGTLSHHPARREAARFERLIAHNTLEIGNTPMGERDDIRVTVKRWMTTEEFDLLDLMHTGYIKAKAPVQHHRLFWFDKRSHLLLIRDRLSTLDDSRNLREEGPELDLTQHFQLPEGPVRLDRSNRAVITAFENRSNVVILPLGGSPLQPSLETTACAPMYGLRRSAQAARFSGLVRLPLDLTVLIYPHQNQSVDLNALRNTGRSVLLRMERETDQGGRVGLRRSS